MKMNRLKIHICIACMMVLSLGKIYAQSQESNAIEFDKLVHNFGKVSVNEGEKHCSFTFKNISDKPIVIYNVVSSCGCTTPVWPKKPIMPNESGKIEVTYLNDQGPYPFDKALTVYSSGSKKPVVLRIKGLAYEKEKSLKEMFPVAIGPLGVKNNIIKGGQITQGNSKEGVFTIANISTKNVTVEFSNLSPGLTLTMENKTVPANQVADVYYKVNTADAVNWGNTDYSATVKCNRVPAKTKISVNCMIVDNFSKLTKEEKNKAPMVIAKSSSYNFGEINAGEEVTATFELTNRGYSTLKIYRIYDDKNALEIVAPESVKASSNFTIKAKVKNTNKKENPVYTITMVTNSPTRPLINLFITGNIK